MSKKSVAYQLGTFAIQWGLMLLGFGILTRIIAPLHLLGPSLPFGTLLDAGLKALIALCLSVIWLFVWDRQVRYYFYRHNK